MGPKKTNIYIYIYIYKQNTYTSSPIFIMPPTINNNTLRKSTRKRKKKKKKKQQKMIDELTPEEKALQLKQKVEQERLEREAKFKKHVEDRKLRIIKKYWYESLVCVLLQF